MMTINTVICETPMMLLKLPCYLKLLDMAVDVLNVLLSAPSIQNQVHILISDLQHKMAKMLRL